MAAVILNDGYVDRFRQGTLSVLEHEKRRLYRWLPLAILATTGTVLAAVVGGLLVDWRDIPASVQAALWKLTVAGGLILVLLFAVVLLVLGRSRTGPSWSEPETPPARARLDLEADEAELQERTKALHALVEAVRELTAESQLEQLLKSMVETARRLTGASYTAIGVFDETGQYLTQFITSGMEGAPRQAAGFLPVGTGVLGQVVNKEGVLRSKDAAPAPPAPSFPTPPQPMRSILNMSIRAHGRLFGELYLMDKQGPGEEITEFTKTDEETVAALALQAGTAIENVTLVKELRSAESQYRLLLESTDQGIYGLDLEDRCTFINKAGALMLGYQPVDVIGKKMHELVHHSFRDGSPYPIAECPINCAFWTGLGCRVDDEVLWKQDGTALPAEYSSYPIMEGGVITGAVVTFTDITERKRAEEVVRSDEERLSAIIATQYDIATADLDQNRLMNLIAERTQALTRASGAAIELVEGEELVLRAASGAATSPLGLRLKAAGGLSGQCVRTGEVLRCDDTGTDTRADLSASRQAGNRSLVVAPVHHARQVIGVLKVFSSKPYAFGDRDVRTVQLMAGLIGAAMRHASEFEEKQALLAERTAALAALQESEERFKGAFHCSGVGMALVAPDGKFLQVNQALCQMLGYSESEFLGMGLQDIGSRNGLESGMALVRKMLEGEIRACETEKQYVRKDDQVVWVKLNASPVHDIHGQPIRFVFLFQDMTTRKRAEENLHRGEDKSRQSS
ncbi:MAG: PAS domain S-box protein [Nitrospirae bacterium]|nr:MAG: PAS domain S-box protein [Nitrospirota bacterium]